MSFDGPYGVYHSAYDSHYWVSRIGDPGFRYTHLMTAVLGHDGAAAGQRRAPAARRRGLRPGAGRLRRPARRNPWSRHPPRHATADRRGGGPGRGRTRAEHADRGRAHCRRARHRRRRPRRDGGEGPPRAGDVRGARDSTEAAADRAAARDGPGRHGILRTGARGRRRLLRLPADHRFDDRPADRRRGRQGPRRRPLHGAAQGDRAIAVAAASRAEGIPHRRQQGRLREPRRQELHHDVVRRDRRRAA